MFIDINPAYLTALMFFLACGGYVFLSLISRLGNTGVRTRQLYGVTSVLLFLYSFNYGLMTISVSETLRHIFWAIGFSSGLLFFPVWVLFLLYMVPPKNMIVMYISKAFIVIGVIIALFCVFSREVVFFMTVTGNQFSYYNSVSFITALVFTAIMAVPLMIFQFKWWNEAELLRFRKLSKIFIVIAPVASAIGFITDLIIPIFTEYTVTPLGPITVLTASLTTYFLMFSSKTQSITVRNVSGFTFSSVMMPILVLDRKNKVGLENKAAAEFFGRSLMDRNIAHYIHYNENPAKQSFFDESFTSESVTVETPSGIRTCDMMLTVEKDKLNDTMFKVVIIQDKTETNYKDSLLEAVNQVSSVLLEPDIGYFEVNLYMAMGMMAKAVDVDRVYVWENHYLDDKLRCSQIYEWSEGAEPRQEREEYTKDISYDDVLTGLEEILSNGQCLNRIVSEMDHEHMMYFKAQGVYSILIAPVFIQDMFWGFVGFEDCHKERVFTENEEKALRSSSRLIVNAMIRNDMTERLDTALTDELTGARNRRYFMELAEAELGRCIDNDHQYSLIIIDVDFFKKVNDAYGHPVGDEVLKILVSRIQNSLKLDTLLARYGGEEFVVSLPDIDIDDVMNTAERIRESIESDEFKIDDLELTVTISLGVASLTAGHSALSDIISNADKALYKAKQTGRNKVVYFEE